MAGIVLDNLETKGRRSASLRWTSWAASGSDHGYYVLEGDAVVARLRG